MFGSAVGSFSFATGFGTLPGPGLLIRICCFSAGRIFPISLANAVVPPAAVDDGF